MDNLILTQDNLKENTITFHTGNTIEPIIFLDSNGDIYVKGKLVTNDMEVVEGMRDFLKNINK